MEAELAAFRAQKEQEVTEQLERQVAKREEIMRNKALIEVRRKESEIRAEIEAQLAIKRAEIRDRLNQLESRAEEFRTAAEEKLRVELEKGLITEEDLEAEVELKRAEEEAELEGQGDRMGRRQAWMDALAGAKGQMPGTAAGAAPALGQVRGGLGSLARPGGLGSAPKPDGDESSRTLAAPVRSPVQRPGGLGGAPPAAGAVTTGGLGSLKPVRQPIQSTIPVVETPSESESMTEEEFDKEPEPLVEEKPSLTQTILNAISEDELTPVVDIPSSESEAPDFAEDTSSSRGPPGGGRFVREGAPDKPAKGPPPTRGPPELDSEAPSEEEEQDLPTLAPVLRPVLQPTPRKVLTPMDVGQSEEPEEDKVTILKPVTRAVLKPASPASSEEE